MAILLMGLLGTGVELLLLEHTEGFWQWVPLLLIAIGLIVLSWGLLYPGRRNIRLLQGTMILFVLSGLVGLVLHYQGNAEFELEMYPSLKGLELFWEAIRGATPTLAPGTMLLHEFKEYRPYDSIEQFRREIGKYVSEEEVSRLERYVTL